MEHDLDPTRGKCVSFAVYTPLSAGVGRVPEEEVVVIIHLEKRQKCQNPTALCSGVDVWLQIIGMFFLKKTRFL